MYGYALKIEDLEDGRRVRFLGIVDEIDKISGVFVLRNSFCKVSCISSKELVENLKVGECIRVFGRVVKITEPEIEVEIIQKVPREVLELYDKVLNKFIFSTE